jgi:hypothetical protein
VGGWVGGREAVGEGGWDSEGGRKGGGREGVSERVRE